MSQDPRASKESAVDAAETIQPGQSLQAASGSGGNGSQEAFGSESGQRFGRYELREAIGAGAMGTVYRAWHTDLQHEVALKVPKLDGPNVDERKERFYREARSAVMLRHENICRVFDLDEVDGQLFIAMEFVEGKPLSSFVRPEQPLSEKKAAVIVRRLALALAHAHEHGVVHRDLKPDNIMISAKTKQPIVMDFGLVQLNRDGLSQDSSELTGEGSLMGTPLYMSPEQVEADPEKIGPQTDIYSLGVILYELLCGRVPFEGPVGVVIASVLSKEPEPVSQRQPGLSPGLVRICERMMAKTREARYASMKDVATDLQQFLKGQTPEGASASGSSESWQASEVTSSPKPKPWPLIVGGAVAAVLLLAVIPLMFMGDSDGPDDTTLTEVPETAPPDSPSVTPESNEITPDNATVESGSDALPSEETVVTAAFERRLPAGIDETPRDVEWFPDSKRILVADYGPSLRVWNVETGELERTLSLYETRADCLMVRVALSPDGRRIVAAIHRNTRDRDYTRGGLVLWEDFQYRGVVATHPHSTKYSMQMLTFAPDSRHVLSVADDGFARLWDVETGEAVKVFDHRNADKSPRRIFDGKFSPDGRQLATASADGLVHLWDVQTGNELDSYAGHGTGVFSATFVGDRRLISACLSDPWIRLWQPDDPDAEAKFFMPGQFKRVAVSPDGQYATVVNQQFQNAMLIDLESRQRVLLHAHQRPLYTSGFSPDGRRLAVSSADGTVSIWQITTTPDSQQSAEPVNLLKPLQLATDVSAAQWRFEPDGTLTGTADADNALTWLRCPVTEAAYRLEVDFTVHEAQPESRIGFTLPVGSTACTLAIGPQNPALTRIEGVPGAEATCPVLEPGQRYGLRIDVTPDRERPQIKVHLDGESIIDWRGDFNRLGLGPSSASSYLDLVISLISGGGLQASFHRVSLQSQDCLVVQAPLPDDFLRQREDPARTDYADLEAGEWQRVFDTPESVADLAGVNLVTRGIEIVGEKGYTGLIVPGIEGRDVIFRGRVINDGFEFARFGVRCEYNPQKHRWPEGSQLIAVCGTRPHRLKMSNAYPGRTTHSVDQLCERVSQPGFEFAVAAIGDRLLTYIDGHLINSMPTSTLPADQNLVGIGLRKTRRAPARMIIEDPEVMVLDSNVPPDAPAQRIGGLYFSHLNDVAELEGLTYDGSEPITIECWTTLLEPEGGLGLLVANKSNEGGLNLRTDQRRWMTAAAGNDRFEANRSLASPAVSGRRTHVATTYGAGAYSLFVNGQLARRETLKHPHIASTRPFCVGSDYLPHAGFTCRMLIHTVRISRGIRYTHDFSPEKILTSDGETLSLHGPRVRGEEWVDQSYHDHPGLIGGARPVPEAICLDPTGDETDNMQHLLSAQADDSVTGALAATLQLPINIDRTETDGFLRADLIGLPEGVACLPAVIPPLVNSMRLKIDVSPEATPGESDLRLLIRSARATKVQSVRLTVTKKE